jgi:hypothetical protein
MCSTDYSKSGGVRSRRCRMARDVDQPKIFALRNRKLERFWVEQPMAFLTALELRHQHCAPAQALLARLGTHQCHREGSNVVKDPSKMVEHTIDV